MSLDGEDAYHFKFHWLDENFMQKGFFRKKGSLTHDVLKLDDLELPTAAIIHVQTAENRMVLGVSTGPDEVRSVPLMPTTKTVTEELKKQLDIARSKIWAQARRDHLEATGRAFEYREATCPHCTATLDLSGMATTPQVYCHFCDSLSTVDQNPPAGEAKLGICDECGMYSQPLRYTVFYFVFLIFVFWTKQFKARKCRACMRADAWKMLFGNLIFILGVPNAIYQLIRSHSGGSIVEGVYAGLNSANIAARKANWPAATDGYRRVLDSVGVSAGVKYNLGLALRNAGSDEQAMRSFELSLDDCSNYAPAYHHLVEIYTSGGEADKLRELNRQWQNDSSNGDEDITGNG